MRRHQDSLEPFIVTAQLGGVEQRFGQPDPAAAEAMCRRFALDVPTSNPRWYPTPGPDGVAWPSAVTIRANALSWPRPEPLHLVLLHAGRPVPALVTTVCGCDIARSHGEFTMNGAPCDACHRFWSDQQDPPTVRYAWLDRALLDQPAVMDPLRRTDSPAPNGQPCAASAVDEGRVASMTVANETNEPAPAVWTIHGERLVDDTRRLDLRIASVELPDGVHFEQYIFRMPKASMTLVVDHEQVLMIWRHRFILDQWVWELPGGYVDPHEDPAMTAARELEEETGWRPKRITPFGTFQPMTGTANFENLLFLAEGVEDTGKPADINEAAKVQWVPLSEIPERIEHGEIPGSAAQIALFKYLALRR